MIEVNALLDAKLGAAEARMDARLASIEGKFNLMFHRMDEMSKDLKDQRLESKADISKIEESVVKIQDSAQQFSNSMKFWVAGAIISVIGTGIAIQQMTVSTFQAAQTQSPNMTAPAKVTTPLTPTLPASK